MKDYTKEQYELSQKVAEAFNEAMGRDANALHSLLCNRVPCSVSLAEDDPHIICAPNSALGDERNYTVSPLGLINGALDSMGLPALAMIWDSSDESDFNTFSGFTIVSNKDEKDKDI